MTAAHRKRILKAHGKICGYCEEPIDGPFEVDHLLLLALGGADDDGGNMVPMHAEGANQLMQFGLREPVAELPAHGGDATIAGGQMSI